MTARSTTTATLSAKARDTERSSKGQTRERILRAAEKLFAEHGVAGTSTRAILQEAGQRNESALQYHFGGREGVLEALYLDRGARIAAERERLLTKLMESGDKITVRRLCEVALMPPVHLTRQEPETRQFLKVVGQMAFLPNERLKEAHERYELGSVAKVRDLLHEILGLPPALLARRLELIHRVAALSLSQRARENESFQGKAADFYFATVLDAMAAILSGPVSIDTDASMKNSRKKASAGRKKR